MRVPLVCDVTRNPVGSDTWPEGQRCQCSSCQLQLLRDAVGCDVHVFVSRTCELGTHCCNTNHSQARVSPERVEELRAAIAELSLSEVAVAKWQTEADSKRLAIARAEVNRLLAQLAGEKS